LGGLALPGTEAMMRFSALTLLSLVLIQIPAWSASPPIELKRAHRGIVLLAMPANPNKKFDAALLPAAQGLQNFAKAIDHLIAKSPFSARKLKRLKKSGRIQLVYLPDDLRNPTGDENTASFLPDFLLKSRKRNREKVFLVVVGRHGIKWPTGELAATLAHELVGHGVQHQRGRLTNIRMIDAECEAYLYEEIANQDLKLDKWNPRMIAFRRALEEHWCADFKAYLRVERPKTMPPWNTLDPDIPKLLTAFESYLQHTARAGVTAKAIDALKEQTRQRREHSLKNATPEVIYRAAVNLRDGAFGIAPDPLEAIRYFRLAAEKGHQKAWVNITFMHKKSLGVTKEYMQAVPSFREAVAHEDPLAYGTNHQLK
jgi:tetratricopeptide (TPR) repeat protein